MLVGFEGCGHVLLKKRDPTRGAEPGLSEEIHTVSCCSERLAHWGWGEAARAKLKTCNIGVGSRLGNPIRSRHGRLSPATLGDDARVPAVVWGIA
jgi:hypothetical protein